MIEFAPVSVNKMTFGEAIMYCTFCNHCGYSDWRLPTWEEYQWYDMRGWYWDNIWFDNFKFMSVVTPVRDV